MRSITFAATFLGLMLGAIGGGGPDAEARPGCRPGHVYRPSARACVPKRATFRASVYRKRYAYRRAVRRESKLRKMQFAAQASMQNVHRTIPAPQPQDIDSPRCDELCKLTINLNLWVRRNRDTFQ